MAPEETRMFFVLVLIVYILRRMLSRIKTADCFVYASRNYVRDQLIVVEDAFVSKDKSRRLRREITSVRENENGLTFASRGLTIRFVDPAAADALFRSFDLFETWKEVNRMRDTSACNAWVANTLIVDPSEERQVQLHYDQTLELYDSRRRHICPRWIDILYLDTPSAGGQFIAWKYNRLSHIISALTQRTTRGKPFVIRPQQGRHARVRGDSLHGVEPLGGNTSRVSIVVESYCLSPEELLHCKATLGGAARFVG